MKNKRIVLALGGNALGDTPKEQQEAVKKTAISIVDLIEKGYQILIGHGNGPQVGMISLAFDEASKINKKVPKLDLILAGAMSQGYIGIHLKNAIDNELLKRKINKNVYALISQAIVDHNDPAFKNPTKPIGGFYSKEESEKLAKNTTWKFIEDAGRGYRRVVPSPKPITLMEKDLINKGLDDGFILIAGGGGAIATYKENDKYNMIDAVIDKDYTAEIMAEMIDADLFIIVTAVEGIYLDYNTPNQRILSNPKIKDLKKLLDQKIFPSGSMGPKVETAIKFASSKLNRKSIITSLAKLKESLEGNKYGTHIEK
ncbi:carbamate kinase [Candidatus Hepatoplasma crinochetorum]|uniref:carbamate kinase n=1 Tax=Candidatus Hepatoplasma crinochetorum TaxID=295596 RepID=UPI0030850C5E|nr:MAG: carbamate kinase [Candidatus Hepatoplasma crinochetorum]